MSATAWVETDRLPVHEGMKCRWVPGSFQLPQDWRDLTAIEWIPRPFAHCLHLLPGQMPTLRVGGLPVRIPCERAYHQLVINLQIREERPQVWQ